MFEHSSKEQPSGLLECFFDFDFDLTRFDDDDDDLSFPTNTKFQ